MSMTEKEKEHKSIAISPTDFVRYVGSDSISSFEKETDDRLLLGVKKWSRPEDHRYIKDPKNPDGTAIDMQHFFAAAQVPLGLGNAFGAIYEVRQKIAGWDSSGDEDIRSNALGTVFGDYYLNDPAKGTTLGQKLQSFFQDYQNKELYIRRGGHDYINPFRIYSSIPQNQSSVIAKRPNESQLNTADIQNGSSSTSRPSSAADRVREKFAALQAQNTGADSKQTPGNSSANGTATLSDRTDKLIAELDSMNPSNASIARSQQLQPNQQIERG